MDIFGSLFDGIAPGTQAQLAAAERRRTFPAGTDLLTVGQQPECLYRIASGRVKIWRPSNDGEAMTLDYFGPGNVLGIVPVARREPMRVTMTAASRVETHCWPATTIHRLLGEDALLSHNALNMVGKALNILSERIEEANSVNAEQRIGRALLRFAGEHAIWTADHHAAIDLSRQDIADLTGSTLFTASRVLSEWSRQGVVKSMRGRVVIRDPESLAAIADV